LFMHVAWHTAPNILLADKAVATNRVVPCPYASVAIFVYIPMSDLFSTIHIRVAVCLLVLLACRQPPEPPADDVQYWTEGRRLSFKDFQGLPAQTDTEQQESTSQNTNIHRYGTIVTALDVLVRTEGGKTSFTIRAAMDKKNSWIRKKEDAITLKHEQGHFDIAEIYARMLRRDIRIAKTLKASQIIYNNIMEAENREHDAYDRENTFELGGTTNAWTAKISKRLQQLAAYRQQKVVLTLSR
jgi:hypothetical protein